MAQDKLKAERPPDYLNLNYLTQSCRHRKTTDLRENPPLKSCQKSEIANIVNNLQNCSLFVSVLLIPSILLRSSCCSFSKD